VRLSDYGYQAGLDDALVRRTQAQAVHAGRGNNRPIGRVTPSVAEVGDLALNSVIAMALDFMC
jgi:hypothetical protein